MKAQDKNPPCTRLAAQLLTVALLLAASALLIAAPTAVAQSTSKVTIQNYAFSPSSITVVVGVNSTVTWTNTDSVSHTVTADGGAFNSPILSSGQTFTYTFSTPGTFSYHCSIHTYMKGTVIVKGSGSGSTSASTTASSQSSGAIPEFPFETVAAVVMMAIIGASYLAIRRPRGG